MSSLTTTTVNTKDSITDLTLSTGNTSGPAIVVSSSTDVSIRANSSANALIANSSGVRVVSNTLNLGTASISNPGHSRLPNGLLMQWGNVVANSSSGTITFSNTFSSVYSITATSNTVNSTFVPAVTSLSTTSATVRTSNATSSTIYWMAIGV